MKKDLIIEIKTNGKEVEIDGNKILVKGKLGNLERNFPKKIKIEKLGEKIILSAKKATRRERKLARTIEAHIKNMLRGVEKEYEYKLQICSVHFPMNVNVNKEKGQIIVKNFLGENKDRITRVPQNVNVEVKGDIISVKSIDKEAAGQTAADIEKITKIKARDRRIFQDGIFIIEKNGKKLL